MDVLSNQNQYESYVNRYALTVVQFGAENCLPCSAIREKITSWAHSREKTGSLYVSVEKFPALAAQFGIFSVPTVLVYAQGKQTVRESGYFSLEQILEKADGYYDLLCDNS